MTADKKTQSQAHPRRPAHLPRVLILDDEWPVRERAAAVLGDEFEVKCVARSVEAQEAMAARHFDVVLTDVRMPDQDGISLVTELKERYPDTQYVLMTAFSAIDDTIAAIRLGVADYLRKPFTDQELVAALHRCLERRAHGDWSNAPHGRPLTLSDLSTQDHRMIRLCRLAGTVATTDATVLISGDTGTGKGILARAIHNVSHRRESPFVTVDCATIPTNLIESELFGHEKGSFTGAVARKLGRVETAAGGTLLLDEIGEMPLDMQTKLLRFLQSFEFERVGSNKMITADVRIVAATNRDLWQSVQKGHFRQDLFYRLHVINLHLPPLRERGSDVLYLARKFLRRFARKYNNPVTGMIPEAEGQLAAHSWPGNVRELENAMERAVILCRSSRIEKFDLAEDRKIWGQGENGGQQGAPAPSADSDLAGYLAECERAYLVSLMIRNQGRVGLSAREAGINPKTLYLKMNRHGIDRKQYRPSRQDK